MCISSFVFANNLLFDVYFVFILDYRNDVREKKKTCIFFEFKMGLKAAETSLKTNNAFGPETANECSGQ